MSTRAGRWIPSKVKVVFLFIFFSVYRLGRIFLACLSGKSVWVGVAEEACQRKLRGDYCRSTGAITGQLLRGGSVDVLLLRPLDTSVPGSTDPTDPNQLAVFKLGLYYNILFPLPLELKLTSTLTAERERLHVNKHPVFL